MHNPSADPPDPSNPPGVRSSALITRGTPRDHTSQHSAHASDFVSNIDISGDEDPYLLELAEDRHRRNETEKCENVPRIDTLAKEKKRKSTMTKYGGC